MQDWYLSSFFSYLLQPVLKILHWGKRHIWAVFTADWEDNIVSTETRGIFVTPITRRTHGFELILEPVTTLTKWSSITGYRMVMIFESKWNVVRIWESSLKSDPNFVSWSDFFTNIYWSHWEIMIKDQLYLEISYIVPEKIVDILVYYVYNITSARLSI